MNRACLILYPIKHTLNSRNKIFSNSEENLSAPANMKCNRNEYVNAYEP